jgi:hypothetical protein
MMNLHGADIFIWTPEIPKLPETIGPFKLILISSRGTKVWPATAADCELDDWPRCRFLAEAEVSDKEVDDLVVHLTSLGWRWTKLQKLFKKDGVDQFSQPY